MITALTGDLDDACLAKNGDNSCIVRAVALVPNCSNPSESAQTSAPACWGTIYNVIGSCGEHAALHI